MQSWRVAPKTVPLAFFYARDNALWQLCAGRLRSGRVPTFPVFLPRTWLPPNPVGRTVTALTEKLEKFMPHLTTSHAFHETGPAQQHLLLFSVTADIPATHALHSACELLSAATHTLDAAATGTLCIDAHQAFLLCHALRAVKATVDALGQDNAL